MSGLSTLGMTTVAANAVAQSLETFGQGGAGAPPSAMREVTGPNVQVYGNTLSGNGGDGLYVETNNGLTLTMNSNFVGTNSSGTGRVGNDGAGVDLVGLVSGTVGSVGLNRNIISANGGAGTVLTGFLTSSTTRIPTVRLTGTEYRAKPGPAAGGSGTQVLSFTATVPGLHRIDLVYKRPWESEPAERRSVPIQVR